MEYSKYFYNRVNWKNKGESLETPLGKTNLNRMDEAIYIIAENLDVVYNELDAKKMNETSATKMISEMPTWDSETGILHFSFYDGTEFNVDFNIEKIPVSFSMDSAGAITMVTSDGTEWTANIGDVIPDYTFTSSDRVIFSKTKDDNGGYAITADIAKGSITGEYLEPDYLSNITTQASKAETSANNASQNAENASYEAKLAQSYSIGGSGVREGEDEDNAKYYAESAKKSANIAEQVSEVGIATTEKAGIVKPDGTTIIIDGEGTIHSYINEDNYIKKEEKGVAGGVASLNEYLSVDKALADGDGNNIKDTYATKEQLEEKVDKSKIANNFTTTEEGFVADARAIRTLNDDIYKINQGLINSFSQNYYNANTDRNNESDRLSALLSVIEEVGFDNINNFIVRVVRYEGGYYVTYLLSRSSHNDLNILEFSKHNEGKIRIYGYAKTTNTIMQVRELWLKQRMELVDWYYFSKWHLYRI